MTEKQWLAGKRFQPLHAHLCDSLRVQRTKSGRRKLRLFACACCRWVWRLLPDAPCRSAVEAAESYAEGETPRGDLDAAFEAARPSMSGRRPNEPAFHA